MITYIYNVVSTNPELKVMDVEYSAEGYQTITVGLPFPAEGADLPAFFASYAPIHIWNSQTVSYMSIPPGMSGILTHDPAPAPTTAPMSNPDQMAAEQAAFEQRVADVLIKLGVVQPDPQQPAP